MTYVYSGDNEVQYPTEEVEVQKSHTPITHRTPLPKMQLCGWQNIWIR